MMRPQELVRSLSDQDSFYFSAPLQPQQNEPQCGMGMFGYTWNPKCLQKFATFKSFAVVLALVGLIHGACIGYFVQTAYIAAEIYNFHKQIIDWLLIGSEVTQGVFGLCVSYWGNRGHRPQWIGSFAVFQAVACFLIIIPHLVHNLQLSDSVSNNDIHTLMCKVTSHPVANAQSSETEWIFIVLLFIIQLGIGLTNTCFLALGLSYIDDNVKRRNSPLLMGVCMSAKHFGPKVGVILAWLCFLNTDKTNSWWIGWPVLAALLLIFGVSVSMFPQVLPARAINEAATSILNQAIGIRFVEPIKSPYEQDPNASIDFWPSFKRIITNKIIVLNIFATLLLETGISNFASLEEKYMQSSFLIPSGSENTGFDDMQSTRLTISLLKPLLVSLAVLISGLVISKLAPAPNKLAAWNIIVALLAALSCIIYIFLDCEALKIRWLHGGTKNGLHHMCNNGCLCPESIPYSPVCAEDNTYTYFSPCHAGCSNVDITGDIKIFYNCSCVTNFSRKFSKANMGPCTDSTCTIHWTLIQIMGVISAALIGSGLVGNILINFRCVQPQDKSLVIGLELTLVGLVAYIPGRILYLLIAYSTCLLQGDSTWKCKMYDSHTFGLYINITTAGLLLLSALLDVFVCYFARVLPLYKEDAINSDNEEDYELGELNMSKTRKKLKARRATPAFQRKQKDFSSTETLDDLSDTSDVQTERDAEPEVQRRLIRDNNFVPHNDNFVSQNGRTPPTSTNL